MSDETQTLPKPEELRSKLLEEGNTLRELREKKAEERDAAWLEDVKKARNEILMLDSMLKVQEAQEERSAGPLAAFANLGEERKTAGQAYVESDTYKTREGRYAGGNIPDVEVRLISTEQDDPAGGLFMPRGTPIPPVPRQQRLFVRDLLSVQETGLNSVPYIRELNPDTNEGGATAVAEGSAKPEVTMQWSSEDAPVRKLAAWIPVTTEVVEDAPTLRGYIDTRLAYMLALREEAQILNGPGTGANIRGIRETTGVETQAFSDSQIATLGLAIGQVENNDGDADGVAMNPTDFWAMMTRRDADSFDGASGVGIPFGNTPNTVWGLRTVRTRSMEAGVALVGSWRLGATLFDRKQTVIRVGDQHSDYFTSNKLVILAEERIALAVHRPDFFVECDVSP